MVDRVWQVSDTDPSQVIYNNSEEALITSGTPLTLAKGYEIGIKYIDINRTWTTFELSKDGSVA